METKIFGDSDDLIEVEGAVSGEVNIYLKDNEKVNFSASDGTKGKISLDDEAQWRIELLAAGNKYKTKIDAVGEDAEHVGDAAECPSYSDVLILKEGIEWVKIGRKTFKSEII